MGRGLTVVSTAVVTAILTSAFWIFTYNIAIAPNDGAVKPAGDVKTVEGTGVAIAEGVEVGPAGIAVPVRFEGRRPMVELTTSAKQETRFSSSRGNRSAQISMPSMKARWRSRLSGVSSAGVVDTGTSISSVRGNMRSFSSMTPMTHPISIRYFVT